MFHHPLNERFHFDLMRLWLRYPNCAIQLRSLNNWQSDASGFVSKELQTHHSNHAASTTLAYREYTFRLNPAAFRWLPNR